MELVDGEKMVDMFEHLKFGLKPRVAYELDYEVFAAFTNNLD